jgi:hypothetical protein
MPLAVLGLQPGVMPLAVLGLQPGAMPLAVLRSPRWGL